MPDFTGSFSGSFEGNGSGLKSIDYYNLSNLPTTITPFQKNSILANNSVRDNFVSNVKTRLNAEGVISSSAQLTTEFDIRYGNEVGDNLISGSAQIKSLLPSGVISGSSQLPIGLVSGSTQVKSLLPNGTISGSSQITITESQISDLQSYLTSVPTGTISSSAQIADLGYITSETDSQTLTYVGDTLTISNGNSVTIPTGSDLPSGIISGSSQLPANIISSSAQITDLGFLKNETDSQTLTLAGNNLSISNGNTVNLSALAGGGGGSGTSIWNTGSQDPNTYTKLMTSNNLEVTGSVDIKGDFTVNGQSIFTQTSASNAGNAIVVNGRIKVLEAQLENYIASASIQIGNTQDTIDCGGFF